MVEKAGTAYADITFLAEDYTFALHAINATMPSECRCYQEIRHDNHYQMYNFFTIIIAVPIVATFGLITNVFSFTIFSRSPMSLFSGNVYLAALAVSDFCVVFTGLFIIWMDSARTYTPLINHFFIKCLPILTFGNMSQTCSVYFTVAAATDCFMRVHCSTPRVSRWCTPRTAAMVIGGIATFAVCYNFVQFWAMTAQSCINKDSGALQYEICPTDLMMAISEAYNVYATAILLTFLPFFLLCLLNGFIIYRVRANKCAAGSKRKATDRISRITDDDTVTMIMVIVLFLSCNILGLIINIAETFKSTPPIVIHYMADMSNLLVTFNSSLNFCIYIGFDKSFRTIFVQRFCCMPAPIGRAALILSRDGSLYQSKHNGFVLAATSRYRRDHESTESVRSQTSLRNSCSEKVGMLASWKGNTTLNNNNVAFEAQNVGCYVPSNGHNFVPMDQTLTDLIDSRSELDKESYKISAGELLQDSPHQLADDSWNLPHHPLVPQMLLTPQVPRRVSFLDDFEGSRQSIKSTDN